MFPYVHIPKLPIGDAFGLLVALGVILGTIIIRRRAVQAGLDEDYVIDSFFIVLPGAFFLSHVLSVLMYNPEWIAKDPLILLRFWQSMSSFGGFLSGLVICIWFYRSKKLPLVPYLDITAYGFVFGMMLGRFACAVAHDHPGLWLPKQIDNPRLLGIGPNGPMFLPGWDAPVTWGALVVLSLIVGFLVSRVQEKPFLSASTFLGSSVFACLFAMIYPVLPSIMRALTVQWPLRRLPQEFMLVWADGSLPTRLQYDLGLIEALYYVLLCATLWFISLSKPKRFGFNLGFWFVSYAPVRFLLDSFRTVDTRYKGLTPGQYLSLLTLAMGLIVFMAMPQQRSDRFDERSYPDPALPHEPEETKSKEAVSGEKKQAAIAVPAQASSGTQRKRKKVKKRKKAK